jgi:hypothetical protein
MLELEYPGTGWVYLGETGAEPLLSYIGRDNTGTDSTKFSLRAQKKGKTLLHFYREDVITNSVIDDYVEVTVDDPKRGQSATVKAPPYKSFDTAEPDAPQTAQTGTRPAQQTPETLPPAPPAAPATPTTPAPPQSTPQQSAPTVTPETQTARADPAAPDAGTRNDGRPTTVIQENNAERPAQAPDTAVQSSSARTPEQGTVQGTVPAQGRPAEPPRTTQPGSALPNAGRDSPSEDDVADLYERALRAYNRGEQTDALSLINRYLATTVVEIDKGLYLRGLILEANSPVQDIKSSFNSYNSLIEQFPSSTLWQPAKNRIIYLNRYYFDIR